MIEELQPKFKDVNKYFSDDFIEIFNEKGYKKFSKFRDLIFGKKYVYRPYDINERKIYNVKKGALLLYDDESDKYFDVSGHFDTIRNYSKKHFSPFMLIRNKETNNIYPIFYFIDEEKTESLESEIIFYDDFDFNDYRIIKWNLNEDEEKQWGKLLEKGKVQESLYEKLLFIYNKYDKNNKRKKLGKIIF